MSKRLVSDLPDDTLIEKVRFSTIIHSAFASSTVSWAREAIVMRVRQSVPSKRLGKFVAARLAERYLKLQQLRDEVKEAEASHKQRPSRPVHLTRR